jgi:hypothetical protein
VRHIVEAQTAPMRLFYEQVVAAADDDLEFVRVRDDVLPADLRQTGHSSSIFWPAPGAGDHRLGGGRRQPRAEAIGAVAHQPPASRPGQDFCAHDAALAGS